MGHFDKSVPAAQITLSLNIGAKQVILLIRQVPSTQEPPMTWANMKGIGILALARPPSACTCTHQPWLVVSSGHAR